MVSVTITMLRRKTGAIIDLAETRPVLITRYGKPAFVLMPVDHYEYISKAHKSPQN